MIRTISMKLAGLGLATALSLSPAYAQTKTLTISWWGFNGDKLEQMVLKPFRAQCGCELVFETGNNADRLNKIKIRGGSGVDVVYLSDSFSQIGVKEGLFQPVDRAKLPNLNGIYELARAPQGPYGPAYTIGRIGIIYDSAKVTTPITSWKDLWREDFRRGLSLPGITTTAGPMTVLIAGAQAGVDPYANPKAAFAALAKLKPNVVKNYNTGSELVNLFSTGEVKAAIAQDFTLAQIQAAVPTARWAQLSDGDFATLNTVNIAKGAANPDLAHQFINFILDPKIQEELAKNGVDAPVATAVQLNPQEASRWTYGAQMVSSLKRVDYEKLNAAKNDWVDEWSEVFGR
ncbi:MAG TPA: ABC transporter substrate-binding protein [Microvirga sp.]|jgi:putative spermidine/putrescine transport system substrate-binding protein|nr:ABC transporter substrate-binding protein [Microvirga sp.]